MSESTPEPEDREILGRLPRRRPGTRSPRRDEEATRRARARAAERPTANRAGHSASESRPERPAGGGTPSAADALGEIARTGTAIAGGAIGLGLRTAGGALKAIRGAVERR